MREDESPEPGSTGAETDGTATLPLGGARRQAAAGPPEGEGPPPAPPAFGPEAAGAPAPAPGGTIGRYVLLYRVGAGGMGVVWAGYDPELDRKVALKLLRPDGDLRGAGGARDVRGAGAEQGRLRLLREAQAAARLQHPNVVTVHDAGTFGEQVFVAMEFVEGPDGSPLTLGAWLAQGGGRRPWREVLPRFLAAGRGLAAAHAAGLVHRDFKPENVLLGRDGRARVADFGLVRSAPEELPPTADIEVDLARREVLRAAAPGADRPPPPAPEPTSGDPVRGPASGPLATPLTEFGRVLGTPAYMAPEQVRGGAADARSDQFSFCVALYEGLYGERPFAGDDAYAVAEAALAGRVRPAPPGTRVPGWLRQVLVRGLAADPAGRWESMETLLGALAGDPAAARRRWLAAAAVVALAVAGAVGFARAERREARLCSGAPAKLAGVWDQPRRERIGAAFAASGAPYAAASWAGVAAALDRFAAGWSAMHREACEATRLRGEQSEELLDRRMFCLDQRLGEVRALSDLFLRADREVVRRAVDAMAALPPLDGCADAAALSERVAPPRGGALRARVEELQARLAEVKALAAAGKHAEGLERARLLAPAARRAGYPPLAAEALFQLGYLEDKLGRSAEAERALFDAFVAAQAGAHYEQTALTAAQLAWVVGFQQARHADGHRWARVAEATIDGLRGDDLLRAQLLLHLGSLVEGEGRHADAAATFRRALALAERAAGRDSPLVASVLSNLGVSEMNQGRLAVARAVTERSLAIRRRALPPDHPDLGKSHNTLGNVLGDLGRIDEAIAQYREALRIFEAAYGPLHPVSAGVLNNLGIGLKDRGDYTGAESHYERALAVVEATLGPEHPMVAMALGNLGELHRLQGRHADSLLRYRRALAIEERALGADHPDRAYSLLGVGEALLALGRPGEALPFLRQALELRAASDVTPTLVANSRFWLARGIWEAGGDRGQALRLARRAREEMAAAGPTHPGDRAMLAEMERWLAERAGQGGGRGG